MAVPIHITEDSFYFRLVKPPYKSNPSRDQQQQQAGSAASALTCGVIALLRR